MPHSITIIICTRDRAKSLEQTLASIGRCAVPHGMTAEVLVVDNGSTDNTREVVCAAGVTNMAVRYLAEPRKGKGYAYNAGMAHAIGGVFLFTDDDVRVPLDWIQGMCRPITEERVDAVAGWVAFPPDLDRRVPQKREWFASTEGINASQPDRMVGANMAFSRRVLASVPGFDPELGPGALGFHDETLFSWQLLKAGFRIAGAADVAVAHHFDSSRLERSSLLAIAERMGRSSAYLSYHWLHEDVDYGHLLELRARARVLYRRCTRFRDRFFGHQAADWEVNQLKALAFLHQYRIESRRPRNYDKFGLVKQPHSVMP